MADNGRVDPEMYQPAFDDAVNRIVELASGDLGRSIPHIPDWTAESAVTHVGLVFSFVQKSISQGSALSDQGVAGWANDTANQPDSVNLSTWFEGVAGELRETIWKHNPEETVWTSSRTFGTAKFWMRRMTQEAAMHRWDIESAYKEPKEIEPRLAVDGIDEFYGFFVSERLPAVFAGNGTLHLHAVDVDGEWMITRNSDGIDVDHSHGKGDVAARGTASDLLLFVWRRQGYDVLETFGDTSLLEEHQRLLQI